MSKRKLDLGDVGSAKSIRAGESSSIKPGLKMNTYNGLPYTPRYFELFRKVTNTVLKNMKYLC